MAFLKNNANEPSKLKYAKKEDILDKKCQDEYRCRNIETNIVKSNTENQKVTLYSFTTNNPISYSINTSICLEDLERKRLELITLQKSIAHLRHSQLKQKRLDAKSVKLQLNSKNFVAIPQIRSCSEKIKKIRYQNKLVESLIYSLNNFEEQQNLSVGQDNEIGASYAFRKVNESLYKIYLGRSGHLKGENKPVFIILSSEAFYIKDTESWHEKHKVLYEDIRIIYVGENLRWISVATRNFSKELLIHFQVDISDPATTKSILKHLEIAARRRWIVVSSSLRNKQRNKNSMAFKLPANGTKFQLPVCRNFSFGKWVEPLLPLITSCSTMEVAYIENWLMKKLKVNKKPRVLACWLVFWENGSHVQSLDDKQVDQGPSLNAFLMVHYSRQRISWTPAYFLLKGGILYQFHDECDEFPNSVIKVREFCGCRKLPSDSRPYAFQLLGKDGNSISFAAPNQDVASLWFQAFMRVLSTTDDDPKEIRKLKPCQVIQTTEALILSYQKDFLTDLKSNSLPEKLETSAGFPSSDGVDLIGKCLSSKLEVKNNVELSSTAKNRGSSTSTMFKGEGSCPSRCVEEKNTSVAACPPTPPVPDFESVFKGHHSEDERKSGNFLQILTSCNLDQISQILVTSWATNGCYLELECSEAGDFAGDWVLYFSTESMLSSFLKLLMEYRKGLTEEKTGLTKVSEGRIYDVLLEGAVMSKSFWKSYK